MKKQWSVFLWIVVATSVSGPCHISIPSARRSQPINQITQVIHAERLRQLVATAKGGTVWQPTEAFKTPNIPE
ncbi:MAG: hypothetical protein ABGZ53_08135 [Fuerstiella sp.]